VVGTVPIEVATPKYVVIVNAVQERIENGTYPPGVMLPSETDLMKEFGASRPIVVRAFDLLRQDGWIESRQGKGRFVLGRASRASRRAREHPYELLDGAETAGTKLLEAGPVKAPARAASALGVEPGTPVVARRRLVVVDGVGPVELGTAYLTENLATGTDVGSSTPLPEGLLRHVAQRKGVEFDHAAERISSRLPSADEAGLLEVGRRDPLLTVLLSVCDRAGKPLLALDVLLPASRHELEDVFPLS
jgi:GntR family transcriptional regulator